MSDPSSLIAVIIFGLIFFFLVVGNRAPKGKHRPSKKAHAKPNRQRQAKPDKLREYSANSWYSAKKGQFGEWIVIEEIKASLPKDDYYLMNDITLELGRGTTQIDHILISVYGVFVIETKHMAGWIFGNPRQKFWTQVFPTSKYRFLNPLRQNRIHIDALRKVTGFPGHYFVPLVVFTAQCELKTEMPENVLYRLDLIDYINEFDTPYMSRQEAREIAEILIDNAIAD